MSVSGTSIMPLQSSKAGRKSKGPRLPGALDTLAGLGAYVTVTFTTFERALRQVPPNGVDFGASAL